MVISVDNDYIEAHKNHNVNLYFQGTTVNTPCPIVYETVSNTLYYDGVVQQGISTENGCRERCTGSRTCVGFDFNYNSNMCYLHTASTYIQANRAPFNGINTFRKLPCDCKYFSTYCQSV